MAMKFCSISSGSKGNCYLLKIDEYIVLVDAGISGKKIFEGLKHNGINPDEVDAILVTHEHSDHVRGIKMVCKKSSKAKIYANIDTWEKIKMEDFEDRHIEIEANNEFNIGKAIIKPFSVHHDAVDPLGYIFSYGERKLSILTDTGHICESIYNNIYDSTLLVIESNHEVNLLRMCSYPYEVKRRILGDYGHLSNEMAAKCISAIITEESPCETILLAHLSKENNTPQLAKLTIMNHIEDCELSENNNINIEVITQNDISDVYIV